MNKPDKQQVAENRLKLDLRDMITEFTLGTLTEESLYGYFSQILLDANVDSTIIVNVLENFGEIGKNEALAIKVNEGW